ncbi:hypothetical protein [Hymenobacter wooponensis]|uniref:Uncharacterized protein n=1 Tax=Hymenobacter wooponensis TaxID=1525360 RepID=A0A4Z0MKI5_9BACT|nr:hypothetical protein [Hymenobacter wooponensis]TGD80352.1 hypothetical protein EU557_10945 [Hymenobacter wooponensis]
MTHYYSFFSRPLEQVAKALPIFLLGTLALAGCKNETEAVPDQSQEYYPLEVGSYRIYDVVDSTFNANVAKVERFQFREEVATEQTADATGRLVYRVVRSRRATPANAWKVDSVITVSASQRNVMELRNNTRRVELVFPVNEGKQWDSNAFNTLSEEDLDSVAKANRNYEVLNRAYSHVGEPFTIVSSGKTYSYPNTVTTMNDLSNSRTGVNAYYYTVLRNVYAQGVGPVYRARRRFIYCQTGNCVPNPAYIYLGQSRSEVLVDSGK